LKEFVTQGKKKPSVKEGPNTPKFKPSRTGRQERIESEVVGQSKERLSRRLEKNT